MEDLNFNFNHFQTKLTPELVNSIPKEVYADLIDIITNIPFVKWLIQPEKERGYAKDRVKHSELSEENPLRQHNDSRIVVDITKPHILQDLDFFRERAIFFDKYGFYTDIMPNANPNSEYKLFWKEEVRRWKDGLIRPSDGEWIPGYLYFYWNYSPIWLVETETVLVKGRTKLKGKRVREFPKPWLGDYLFFHYIDQARQEGKHGKALKARGKGISFKFSSVSPNNMYTLPGSGNPNFHLASDKTFLSGDKGVFGKIVDNLDWLGAHTPLPKLRLIDSIRSMEIQLGYSDEYGARKGLLSSVTGISLKDNPDKARGIRGPFIHYEEDGLFPNLEEAWNINRKAVEDGDVASGFMFAAGTGGTTGASFAGSQKLFYNPDVFNIYGVNNVYDKGVNTSSKCGFFWGEYMNRNGCYDYITGEPDVIKALLEVLNDRYLVKYSSTDANAITQKKAEEPITPQESIMQVGSNLFPVNDIKEYLSEIRPNIQNFVAQHFVGNLVIKNGQIVFISDDTINPIREYPLENKGNIQGALEIFELPSTNSSGAIMNFRYIAGIDPIDDDSSTTNSLPSILIMDRFTNRIVAEYTGRPKFADDFYEVCARLLQFYNATANYENDKKGLFNYFKQKHILHLLCATPSWLKDKQIVKATNLYGNKMLGTNSGKEVNAAGRRLQRDWMLQPAYGEEESGKLNLHKIRSVGYLEEALQWNIDGNFDRISAVGMLMIYKEELYNLDVKGEEIQASKIFDDPFFKRYDKNATPKNMYGAPIN